MSGVSRRGALAGTAAAVAVAAGGGGVLAGLARATPPTPRRGPGLRPPGAPAPSIQHDYDDLLAPPVTLNGAAFRFPPVYTVFQTLQLQRPVARADQRLVEEFLTALESRFGVGPTGLLLTVGYGQPYLRRLPPALVAAHLPRLADDPTRPAFAEAVPAPTDVTPGGSVRKARLHTAVAIGADDVLVTLRSDTLDVLLHAADLLRGARALPGAPSAGRLRALWAETSRRVVFDRPGLPRQVADAAQLPYADRVHPQSPMWMGFSDHQASASATAAATTFAGTPATRLTTAAAGDYLADASVQHLSHVLLDLDTFYLPDPTRLGDDEASYRKRVQYMFRASEPPADGYADQFSDGGGPTFLPNQFRGVTDAERGARGIGVPDRVGRLGHTSALQRASRAADGTPLHRRVDGPGFDGIDAPGGRPAPKLHFSVYMATADAFTRMRRAGAGTDLVARYGLAERDNGIERFLTATRRQNFLVPPTAARSLPFVELL